MQLTQENSILEIKEKQKNLILFIALYCKQAIIHLYIPSYIFSHIHSYILP